MVLHRTQSDYTVTDWDIPDPGASGAIPVTKSGICSLVSATTETRTLPAPLYPAQWLVLCLKTDGGDITLTCDTLFNVTGDNTMVFDTAGEMTMLVAVYSGSDLRWRALACQPEGDGVTFSTV